MANDTKEWNERTDFSRSNTRMVRRRMVLDVFDTDPRLAEAAVFWMGDDAFVATEYTVRHGQEEYHCTKIFTQGREFRVIQSLEMINDFLFGEY